MAQRCRSAVCPARARQSPGRAVGGGRQSCGGAPGRSVPRSGWTFQATVAVAKVAHWVTPRCSGLWCSGLKAVTDVDLRYNSGSTRLSVLPPPSTRPAVLFSWSNQGDCGSLCGWGPVRNSELRLKYSEGSGGGGRGGALIPTVAPGLQKGRVFVGREAAVGGSTPADTGAEQPAGETAWLWKGCWGPRERASLPATAGGAS